MFRFKTPLHQKHCKLADTSVQTHNTELIKWILFPSLYWGLRPTTRLWSER